MSNLSGKESKLGGVKAWSVVICGAFFYCYQFIIRASPNVMNDELMSAFSIDAATLGAIIGYYYLGYSWIQIPLGITMDKFGPRRLLAAAGFLLGAACFCFAYTTNITIVSIARVVMGIGSACGFVGTLKLGSLWFSPHKFSRVVATTMVFGTSGAVLAGMPLSTLVDYAGWQMAMYILAGIGVFMGFAIIIFVQNSPQGNKISYDNTEDTHLLTGLFLALKSPQAWIISVIGLLMYVPITVMGDTWAVPYIRNLFAINDAHAAVISASAMFLGAAFGSPVFTFFSDRIRSRKIPLFIGNVICLITYLIILYSPIPQYAMAVLFFIAGFSYTSKCLCFAAICESMPPHSTAIAVSFTNMVVMLSGAVCHPTIGYLINKSWDGTIVDGGPLYSVDDYRFALTLVPVCLAVSLIFVNFLKETHPAQNMYKLRRRVRPNNHISN